MEKKITPDEIPALTNEALAIGNIFLSTVGTFPTNLAQVLAKLPAIISFFKQSKPHFEVIIKEIKD